MALTLKEAITATQTTIDVNGTDALSNGLVFDLDDEHIVIATANLGSIQPGETAYQRLSVVRGALGSVEAAHAAGTTLVAFEVGAGGGGLSNPLLEPFSIDSEEEEVLVVDGAPAADQSNVVLVTADGVNVFEIYSDGSVQSTIRLDDTAGFAITRSGGALTGAITVFTEYGVEFKAVGGGTLAWFGRDSGGEFGVFGAISGQAAAIADATDPASTMAGLNSVLAALRAYGLLDT